MKYKTHKQIHGELMRDAEYRAAYEGEERCEGEAEVKSVPLTEVMPQSPSQPAVNVAYEEELARAKEQNPS